MNGTLRRPGLWIGLVSLSAVLYVAVIDIERTAPGPLTAVHAREPALDGGRDCASCHGGWWTSMAEACLACHDAIEGQMAAGDGLHGRLSTDQRGQCALCHSEHHGASFAIVNRQSFAQAGAKEIAQFDHRTVGFTMDGRHLELACVKCHVHAEAQPLPKGGFRYLGLDQSCVTCHDDPHQGRMAQACTTCHGQQSFTDLRAQDHDRHLALVGGHAELDCRTCHAAATPHALEALGRSDAPAARQCQDCHASPHDGEFLAGNAALANTPPAMACVVCHQADHVTFTDERLDLTPEQHAASGFPLDPPHQSATCEACHTPTLEFGARYSDRARDACQACHGDPHDGQFAGGPFGPGGCVGCHDRQHFSPHQFTVAKHAESAFPLTDSHLDAACDHCHEVPEPDQPRRFRGTPTQCAACHADAHEGFFAARAGTASGDAGACDHCHTPTRFADVPAAHFDHLAATGFAVCGAHAQAACDSCHRRSSTPDAAGRTFGWVQQIFGAGVGCVRCHRDPHERAFEAPHLPAVLEGRTGCTRCHGETTFRVLPYPFDHGFWTGYALEGEHAGLECSACHEPLRQPDATGRTWQRAAGTTCAACHADPHAEQFVQQGEVRCERCHRNTESFATLSFNHNLDARFRLGDAHDQVPCASCHKPFSHRGREVARYRPLDRECAACHGTQDGGLTKRKGRTR